jgi:ankyrin repeat protein
MTPHALERIIKAIEDSNFHLFHYLLAEADSTTDTPAGFLGRTLLHTVVEAGNEKALRFLLSIKANVDARDNSQKTALHVAAQKGYADSVRLLLEQGALIHLKDSAGSLPIHLAVKDCHETVVRILLEYYSPVDWEDNQGNSPLYYAITTNSESIASLLLTKSTRLVSQNSILLKTSSMGFANILELSLAISMSIEIKREILFSASLAGHVSIVETLLDGGLDPNIQNEEGWTALHYAVTYRQHYHISPRGKEEVMQLLLWKGAYIFENIAGQTALHILVQGLSMLEALGFVPMLQLELLLAAGAGWSKKDHQGNTFSGLLTRNVSSELREEILGELETFHRERVGGFKAQFKLTNCTDEVAENYFKIRGKGAYMVKWWLLTWDWDLPTEIQDKIVEYILMPYGLSAAGARCLRALLVGKFGQPIGSDKTIHGKRGRAEGTALPLEAGLCSFQM